MKLFLIHVGFYDPEIMEGLYEQHSNYFVVAQNIKEAKKKAADIKAAKEEYSSLDHILTPHHEKLSEEEIDYVIKKYNLNKAKLPAISLSDPAVKSISVQSGDVVKITRISPTSGEMYYYRMVISD